jgi:hypothetical protein
MSFELTDPWIGDPLLYFPQPEFLQTRNMASAEDGKPFAAIITFVWNKRLVNLKVWDHYGNEHFCSNVPIVYATDAIDMKCEHAMFQFDHEALAYPTNAN